MAKTLVDKLKMSVGALTAAAVIGCVPANYDADSIPSTSAPSETYSAPVESRSSEEGTDYNNQIEQLAERLEDENYVPTLDDFKVALGERYQPERGEELREVWGKMNSEVKHSWSSLYACPKILFGGEISPELRLDYQEWNIEQLSQEDREKLEKETPWKSIPDGSGTEADKAVMYSASDSWHKFLKINIF